MPAYKDKVKGTWYASFYYENWTGKKEKKMKRGVSIMFINGLVVAVVLLFSFGVEVTIRHKKSGREGDVARGVAKLAERKPSSKAGYKLYWDVAAYDGDGDVISDGVIAVKVVPKDYLAQKLAERGQA